MLTAVQGVIRDNSVFVNKDEISSFNGRIVTIIINEAFEDKKSKQDKSKFFGAVGKIDIDGDAVDELRQASLI